MIFKAIDACGNTATISATFTIEDKTAPVITCPASISVACDANITFVAPSASDACSGTLTPAKVGAYVVNSTHTTFTQTWKATDDCGNTSSCSQTITRPPCRGHIYPTATTCTSFLDNAPQLDVICCVTEKKGNIMTVSNATPGVFFYYTKIIAPSSDFTVDIFQANTLATFNLFAITSNSVFAWNANCIKIADGLQTSTTGQGQIHITGVQAGDQIVISVKYDTKTLIGSTLIPVAGIGPDVTYYFGAKINGVHVTGSLGSVLVSNCKTTTTITRIATQPLIAEPAAFAVKAFPNPTEHQFTLVLENASNEKVQVVVYDVLGRQVKRFERIDSKSQIRFGEDLKIGAYMVEVRQGNNWKTIKLIKQ